MEVEEDEEAVQAERIGAKAGPITRHFKAKPSHFVPARRLVLSPTPSFDRWSLEFQLGSDAKMSIGLDPPGTRTRTHTRTHTHLGLVWRRASGVRAS